MHNTVNAPVYTMLRRGKTVANVYDLRTAWL